MSLKNVELQVALPRTQDLGKMQEQMQNHSAIVQSQLAQETIKKEELNRKRVTENEAIDKYRLEHKQQDKNTRPKKRPAKHPYKGQHFDCTM